MFNNFFPIVDTCLSCEDTARHKLCDGAKMAIFCVLYFQQAAYSAFQAAATYFSQNLHTRDFGLLTSIYRKLPVKL